MVRVSGRKPETCWDQSAWMLALSSEWYRTYWTNQADNNLSSSMLNKSIASHFLHYYWILLTAGFVPSFKCVLTAEWPVQEVYQLYLQWSVQEVFFFCSWSKKARTPLAFFPLEGADIYLVISLFWAIIISS